MREKNEDGTFGALVDGQAYSFTLWPAGKSLETLAELSNLFSGFGQAVGNLMDGAKAAEGNVSSDLLGQCIEAIAQGMGKNPKLTVSMCRRLTSEGVLCDNQPVRFDEHYRGRSVHMLKVARAALEVQYEDFFSVWQNKADLPGMTAKSGMN